MDLHEPLGSRPPFHSRAPRLAMLVAGAALAGLVGVGAFYVVTADPHGGEPYAVAAIPPAPRPSAVPTSATPVAGAGPPSAVTMDTTPTGTIAAGRLANGDLVRIENGVKVVSPADPSRTERRDTSPLVIDVSKALDGNARKSGSVSDASMTRAGSGSSTSNAAKPKIAIFVGGLGLGDAQAQAAIDTLPAAVSLAFVPYPADIAATASAAKAKGHEVLLQLPMQSAQGTTPGPHALRSTESRTELAADLDWLTRRFDGYAGVTNLLGAPVTANAAAMTTVLKSVAAHGVFYLDDGTSRRSLAPTLGRSLGIATLQTDVVLDATNDPAVVTANLEHLVTVARTKGIAIGMASGLSDHLAIVARFARELDARGFALVPVGEIARERHSVATSR